jgi:S-DNA-T family DNA segregation ATPase FtsK/SpoIIIE
MALHALSVRIVAPLPGKGVIGVEVPNTKRETVYLRDVLVSDVFRKSKSKLTMALGKDIEGKPVVTDLAKLPHLLISGATGSGKSVALNSMLLSMLYKATPEDVRIILVDPKVVELQIFEGIPHLLLPVVYDAKHAAQALKWAVGEMERRYELLARYGVRNIDSFNQLVAKAKDGQNIPYTPGREPVDPDELTRMSAIVIVVDEFADLMMVASKDVESSVARLAQKARAAGIHLIMATQRPSKDVVTGLIKANFPARISFRVSSKVDSRIVLDQNGAESLLGYGDMLFLKPGTSIVQRIHGAFTSEDDVKRVTNAWRAQGSPDYEMDILRSDEEETGIDPKELDPRIEEAKQVVIESKRASISYLQRRMKIGYNRSARMMEQLEKLGVVGPPDHKGEREVLG